MASLEVRTVESVSRRGVDVESTESREVVTSVLGGGLLIHS